MKNSLYLELTPKVDVLALGVALVPTVGVSTPEGLDKRMNSSLMEGFGEIVVEARAG